MPAVTLTSAATQPVPLPLTLYDLPQTLPLAVAVAVLPALATSLIMIRRPDPAAELRAAEAAPRSWLDGRGAFSFIRPPPR